jgi:tRNA(fMet)-specific endonuclease VapC
MKYLLDTNICVYWLNGKQTIERTAIDKGLENLAISFITLSELYYGAYKSKKVEKNLSALKTLEGKLSVVQSSQSVCRSFGKLKANLAKNGNIIDDADIFIACCATETNRVLVTNNSKHFERIKGLKIENWAEPPETKSPEKAEP